MKSNRPMPERRNQPPDTSEEERNLEKHDVTPLTADERDRLVRAATHRELRFFDLRGADFTLRIMDGINLEGSDLRGAEFSGSNFSGARLRGADLRELVVPLEPAQRAYAIEQGAIVDDEPSES